MDLGPLADERFEHACFIGAERLDQFAAPALRSPIRISSCGQLSQNIPGAKNLPMKRARHPVVSRLFGRLSDGTRVRLYSITNGNVELHATDFGAIITSLHVPDRHGNKSDVVVGYSQLQPYLDNPSYFGAVVGRYANRIAHGRFTLGGTTYQLATNDGRHHLHGGYRGFHLHQWRATPVEEDAGWGVAFTRTSPAGEERYPGTLHATVTYLVSADDTVILRYEAQTDTATIVNLSQHTYFNLGNPGTVSDVLDHELHVAAERYLPIDSTRIPTGRILDVTMTPFDFRTRAGLRDRIAGNDEQLRRAGGFDHTLVVTRASGDLVHVAELVELESGRSMRVATTEPGLHLYSGQLLDGSKTDASGRRLRPHAALCLETQHFPNSPNNAHFPSVTLYPAQRYTSTTTWKFSIV